MRAFKQLSAIVRIQVQETLRDRSFFLVLFFGVLLIFSSVILSKMSVAGEKRILQNSGFWVCGFWGVVCNMYLCNKNYFNDFQRKTIYLFLSRPISRPLFICSRFLGNCTVLFFIFISLAAVWMTLLLSFNATVSYQHVIALAFIFLEWMLLSAFSQVFISFSSPLPHHFFLLGVYLTGHLSSDLLRYSEMAKDQWIKLVLQIFYYLIPHLEVLNFRREAVYQEAISAYAVMTGAVTFLVWIFFGLVFSILVFSKRRIR